MRAVELFTGAGGLGIGVSQAGFEPVAVVERDRYCCDTIRENQEKSLEPLVNWPLVQGDVRDFDYGEIGGDVDLVSGGPPCQPFSLGGKHRGYLDTRDMFPEAIRAVRELKPRAFLFENVKGLTRPAFANYFEYMRLQLAYPSRNGEFIARNADLIRQNAERIDRNGELITQLRERMTAVEVRVGGLEEVVRFFHPPESGPQQNP